MSIAEPIPLDLSGTAGAAAISGTGWGYHIAIGGHSYLVDLESGEFRYRSVPLLRPQTDDSKQPGESSVNPEDAWRRGVTSWHLGAGQPNADRDPTGRDISSSRFRTSKGIDIWTDDQISLLNDTDQKRASVESNLKMVTAGSYLYFIDGSTLGFVSDPSVATWSPTSVSGVAGALLDVASDGSKVYTTSGANVYVETAGAGAATLFSTADIDVLGYTKGRLMGAEDNEIFYCTDFTLGTFTSLFAHGNTAFRWIGFAEGQAAIYAAGNGGNRGLIYRIPIKPDGSALDVPIVAGETLPGETITGIGGGLGFVVIGTTKGIRFCEPDAQGNLTLGAPFGPTSSRCFVFHDRYCWFGWTNYDGTSTGLGRFTPRRFSEIGERIPAYASDLMVTAQGAVSTVAVFADLVYFAISAVGFYGQDTTLVTSGTLDSGDYGFGVLDEKLAISLDIAFVDFVGTVAASLSTDGGTFTQIGSTTTAASTSDRYHPNEARGERHEIRLTLTRATTTTGPTVTRWGMRTQVVPADGLSYLHYVPIVMRSKIMLEGGSETTFDVQGELEYLRGLYQNRDVVTYQRGIVSHQVVVDDFEDRMDKLIDGVFEGSLLLALKEI